MFIQLRRILRMHCVNPRFVQPQLQALAVPPLRSQVQMTFLQIVSGQVVQTLLQPIHCSQTAAVDKSTMLQVVSVCSRCGLRS